MAEAVSKKRITKNAGALYLRTLIATLVSLYTSRVVLEALGVNNFGIYALIAGFVTLFGVLNSAMSSATSRFLTFEIGQENWEKLRKTFSSSFIIHLFLSGLVLILAETVGLWFLNTQLDIAPERMIAANWVYQFSIFSCLLSITQIPYNAILIARERFRFYALVSILQSFLKLGIAFLLLYVKIFDNLIFYAAMTLGVSIIIILIYRIYCIRGFNECKLIWHYDKEIGKPMLKFSLLDLYGNLSGAFRLQGTNIILNIFGGTAVNAAASLAMTVNNTISNFALNIFSAFSPQIIKQYAAGQIEKMYDLMLTAAKFIAIMFGFFAIPLIIEMPFVLNLWLKDVPDHTVAFCRILLLGEVLGLMNQILGIGIHATGKIWRISFISGTLYYLELPFIYFLVKNTGDYNFAYWVHVCFMILIMMTNTAIARFQIGSGFRWPQFLLKGFAVPMVVLTLAFLSAYWISGYFNGGWMELSAVIGMSTATLLILTLLTLNHSQKGAAYRLLRGVRGC